MTIAVTRLDLSVAELRRRARLAVDADQARRILAIALVLEGGSRDAAARAAGAQRQTLRDWVIRYIAEGLDGLKDCPKPGRTPHPSGDHLKALDRLVDQGPDIAADKAVAQERFGVTLSERSIGRILGQRRFVRLSVRPQHPDAYEAAQEAFKKTLPRR